MPKLNIPCKDCLTLPMCRTRLTIMLQEICTLDFMELFLYVTISAIEEGRIDSQVIKSLEEDCAILESFNKRIKDKKVNNYMIINYLITDKDNKYIKSINERLCDLR